MVFNFNIREFSVTPEITEIRVLCRNFNIFFSRFQQVWFSCFLDLEKHWQLSRAIEDMSLELYFYIEYMHWGNENFLFFSWHPWNYWNFTKKKTVQIYPKIWTINIYTYRSSIYWTSQLAHYICMAAVLLPWYEYMTQVCVAINLVGALFLFPLLTAHRPYTTSKCLVTREVYTISASHMASLTSWQQCKSKDRSYSDFKYFLYLD